MRCDVQDIFKITPQENDLSSHVQPMEVWWDQTYTPWFAAVLFQAEGQQQEPQALWPIDALEFNQVKWRRLFAWTHSNHVFEYSYGETHTSYVIF